MSWTRMIRLRLLLPSTVTNPNSIRWERLVLSINARTGQRSGPATLSWRCGPQPLCWYALAIISVCSIDRCSWLRSWLEGWPTWPCDPPGGHTNILYLARLESTKLPKATGFFWGKSVSSCLFLRACSFSFLFLLLALFRSLDKIDARARSTFVVARPYPQEKKEENQTVESEGKQEKVPLVSWHYF